MLCVTEDIHSFFEAFEGLFAEINLTKKWLLCCSYNPNKNKSLSHLHAIGKVLDDLSKKYYNIILLGDFNNEPEEKNVKCPKHLSFKKCFLNMGSQIFINWFLPSLNYTFHNKNPTFKPSKTVKDSKTIYFDRNLIMRYQNLMCVT